MNSSTNTNKIVSFAVFLIPIVIIVVLSLVMGDKTRAAAQFYRYWGLIITVVFGIVLVAFGWYTFSSYSNSNNNQQQQADNRVKLVILAVLTVVFMFRIWWTYFVFSAKNSTVAGIQYVSTTASAMQTARKMVR